MKAFTVFGVWYKDEAVSVAVVEGAHHGALTGDSDSFAESEELSGSWSMFVKAETAEEAERKATTTGDDYEPLTDLSNTGVSNAYHVKDNVTGARVSRQFPAFGEAAALCAAMNSETPGGRYGVYDQNDCRVHFGAEESEEG